MCFLLNLHEIISLECFVTKNSGPKRLLRKKPNCNIIWFCWQFCSPTNVRTRNCGTTALFKESQPLLEPAFRVYWAIIGLPVWCPASGLLSLINLPRWRKILSAHASHRAASGPDSPKSNEGNKFIGLYAGDTTLINYCSVRIYVFNVISITVSVFHFEIESCFWTANSWIYN